MSLLTGRSAVNEKESTLILFCLDFFKRLLAGEPFTTCFVARPGGLGESTADNNDTEKQKPTNWELANLMRSVEC